jgi:hypothetical protein
MPKATRKYTADQCRRERDARVDIVHGTLTVTVAMLRPNWFVAYRV